MLRDLDHRDTLVMKGLAITAIVLHNYFHLLRCSVHENEFDFDPARFGRLCSAIRDPMLAVQALFSYFGHFGVQVFIFLSAYGLAKSHWDDVSDWRGFLWTRIRKLYPVFGLVIGSWFLLCLVNHALISGWATARELLYMSLGISNFLPGHGLPPVGPWWFIPFIMQFYALWPFARRFTNRFGQYGLVVATCFSIAAIYVADPYLAHWSVNLMDTPAGHVPELCLGIAAARFPSYARAPLVPAACVIVLLGSRFRVFWPVTFTAALIVFVTLYLRIRNLLQTNRTLQSIGRYSLVIFLLNGIVRVPFLGLATTPSMELLYGFVSAATSFCLAVVLQSLLPASVRNRLAGPLVKPISDHFNGRYSLGRIPVVSASANIE